MANEQTAALNAIRPGRTNMPAVDHQLIIAVSVLLLFGLLIVYSASIALADGPRYASYGQYYFVVRHAVLLLLGVFVALMVANVPMDVWQRYAIPIFLISVLLLTLVLVPGIGRGVNGARRWL